NPTIYALSLHDALPIFEVWFIYALRSYAPSHDDDIRYSSEAHKTPKSRGGRNGFHGTRTSADKRASASRIRRARGKHPLLTETRSEEHTSELQSPDHLV